MVKKLQACIVILFLILAIIPAASLSATGEPVVTDTKTDIIYPNSIRFSLSANSNEDITDVRLYYTVERTSFAEIYSEVSLKYEKQKQVDVSWSWDFRYTGGLPPGTEITYWWTVEDEGGDITQTEPQKVSYSDNRYEWGSISQDNVTIYWYEGPDSFAEELMGTAQGALERLVEDIGAYLKEEVEIYIYASADALRQSMVFPQEWTGGVAYPQYNTIAIGIAPSDLIWGKRAVVHELAHLVTYQMTTNPYSTTPTWLNEGISMYAEGALEYYFQDELDNALKEDNLISVRSIASPFSALTEYSYLSYAESYSIVEFLVEAYGQANLKKLLETFAIGSGYDEALLNVYGFNMEGLNDLWQYHIKNPDVPITPLDEIGEVIEQGFEEAVEEIEEHGIVILITVIGIAVIVIAFSTAVLIRRRRHE